MMKTYEYRIYPTSQQEEIFNQTLGLCRLYWNTVVFNKNQDHNINLLVIPYWDFDNIEKILEDYLSSLE